MKPQTRFSVGLSATALWRFNGLKIVGRVFHAIETPTILNRSFFGHKLFLDVSRSNVQKLLYLEGSRFIRERYLIADLVRPGDTVVDVGANIGYYALMFSSLVGARGQVLCFEPEPNNLIELRRNVSSNKLANVKVIEAAVGEKNGRSQISCGLNGMVCEDGNGDLEVDLITLDSVINNRIDFLKIDVEGYEGQVLAGARRLIEGHRPAMFVEVHPALLTAQYTVSDILNFAAQFYSKVELYETEEFGWADKVASRYFVSPIIKSITGDVALRKDIFWMLCK